MKDTQTQKVEYVFDNAKFINDLHAHFGKSLRDIQSKTGISAATLSRISRNSPPDLNTLLTACSLMDKVPGLYFRRQTWELVETD